MRKLFRIMSHVACLFCFIVSACASDGTSSLGKPSSQATPYVLTDQQIEHLTEKANAGDVAAMNRLSVYFLLATPDYNEGIRWMRMAAMAGDPKAQYNLGVTYESDSKLGNASLSKFWLEKSAQAGFTPAREELELIDKLERRKSKK